jgi:hypothetical protein
MKPPDIRCSNCGRAFHGLSDCDINAEGAFDRMREEPLPLPPKFGLEVLVPALGGGTAWMRVRPLGGEPYVWDTWEQTQAARDLCYGAPEVAHLARIVEVDGQCPAEFEEAGVTQGRVTSVKRGRCRLALGHEGPHMGSDGRP